MEKKRYTIEDARREIKESLAEGFGFDYVRIFINDLARGKDITWDESRQLMRELVTSDVFIGIGTL